MATVEQDFCSAVYYKDFPSNSHVTFSSQNPVQLKIHDLVWNFYATTELKSKKPSRTDEPLSSFLCVKEKEWNCNQTCKLDFLFNNSRHFVFFSRTSFKLLLHCFSVCLFKNISKYEYIGIMECTLFPLSFSPFVVPFSFVCFRLNDNESLDFLYILRLCCFFFVSPL